MPSKEEKSERAGEGGGEGDRTAEKKSRKKAKARGAWNEKAVDCVTSRDSRSCAGDLCSRVSGGGEQKGGKSRDGTVKEAPPHTYTSDNKKGSIRRWVGGNINRGGETVLEGERQAGPEK